MRTPPKAAPTIVPINRPFALLLWSDIDAAVYDGVVAESVSVPIVAEESLSTSVEL